VPRIVIVGDRNSGKTTFLGLLYTAQVKSGSDKADDFRFHAAFESLDEISGVFQRLMSGSFPDSATKEGIREITFRLGYRRLGRGIFSRRRSEGWASDSSVAFQLIVVKSFEDDVARHREGSSIADATLRNVIGSDAIVIMVDATKLVVADDAEHRPLGKYDAAMESLLTAIQRSRAHAESTVVHPIFVFSKFDKVEPDALHRANLDRAPPAVRKKGAREAFAKALLDPNLPKTMAKVRARERRGLEFATPSYFFSWVRTDETASSRSEKVRLRRSGPVGWEPDYSSDEYVAFLECIWDIGSHMKV
jgi:hypothetical protein